MLKKYKLPAKRDSKIFKQLLTDEKEGIVNCEVYLSEDLGIKKGDKVEVTIKK